VIDLTRLKGFEIKNGQLKFPTTKPAHDEISSPETEKKTGQIVTETVLIGDEQQQLDYTLAACCNPIPGDEVFGFTTVSEGIKIHRSNCPNAEELLSKYAYRVIKARWKQAGGVEFEVGLKFSGIDDVGIVQAITNIISTDMNVNMRAISFEAVDGIFRGRMVVLVRDTKHLSSLIQHLRDVEGVLTVERIESEFA
jgi:guanosine-3',5'-bis(diphosphate) 3'-pyrophosphohydrolase